RPLSRRLPPSVRRATAGPSPQALTNEESSLSKVISAWPISLDRSVQNPCGDHPGALGGDRDPFGVQTVLRGPNGQFGLVHAAVLGVGGLGVVVDESIPLAGRQIQRSRAGKSGPGGTSALGVLLDTHLGLPLRDGLALGVDLVHAPRPGAFVVVQGHLLATHVLLADRHKHPDRRATAHDQQQSGEDDTEHGELATTSATVPGRTWWRPQGHVVHGRGRGLFLVVPAV